MVSLDIDTLQTDVMQAEQRLYEVEHIYGKQSEEYRGALTRFARIWYVMKMRRNPEEFVPDFISAN